MMEEPLCPDCLKPLHCSTKNGRRWLCRDLFEEFFSCLKCFFLGFKTPNEFNTTIHECMGMPFLMRLGPINAGIFGRGLFRSSSSAIRNILSIGNETKILSPIIERVPVYVVNLHFLVNRSPQDHLMKTNSPSFSFLMPHLQRIKAFAVWRIFRIPLPLQKMFITIIDNGNLVFGQWNLNHAVIL